MKNSVMFSGCSWCHGEENKLRSGSFCSTLYTVCLKMLEMHYFCGNSCKSEYCANKRMINNLSLGSIIKKKKCKVHPCTGTEALYRPYDPQGELRCSSTLSWPMALEGGEGSASCPGCSLPPGKTQYPLYRRLGGPQGQSRQVRKISPPPGFDPSTVQPVASCYADWATRPTSLIIAIWNPNCKFFFSHHPSHKYINLRGV